MKKEYKIALYVLVALIIVTSGVTYAYFAANVGGTGNAQEAQSGTAVSLGSVKYDGDLSFTGTDAYPGYQNFQKFTISGDQTGSGIYEIDLASTLPSEFGSDVEITLYKTTDPTNNYLTRTEGTLTKTDDTFAKVDTLTTTGTLTKVYGTKALTNNSKTILETKDFTVPGLETTTYYLVYSYKNNGNQDSQQGKTFSGKVTVNLTLNKESTSGTIATDAITALAATDTINLTYDGTSDNNLRYIGANPNNYVDIGNGNYTTDIYGADPPFTSSADCISFRKSYFENTDEEISTYHLCDKIASVGDKILWRIIGVMNNIDDGTGTKESRLKIIRNASIGSYSWDSSDSTVNRGLGVNEWSQADLMTTLNSGAYWNRTSGTCYSDASNATTACDFSSTGLTSTSQNVLGNAVWNTGSNGSNDYSQTATGLASNFYTYERSSANGKICTSGTECNDTVTRTTTWIGKVGLMYPSDYGYATAGGSTTNRAACLAKELYRWSGVSDCFNNDWLYNSSLYQCTITPYAYFSSAGRVFCVASSGDVYTDYASTAQPARPVGYLTSSTKILSGDGSNSNPYTLG